MHPLATKHRRATVLRASWLLVALCAVAIKKMKKGKKGDGGS